MDPKSYGNAFEGNLTAITATIEPLGQDQKLSTRTACLKRHIITEASDPELLEFASSVPLECTARSMSLRRFRAFVAISINWLLGKPQEPIHDTISRNLGQEVAVASTNAEAPVSGEPAAAPIFAKDRPRWADTR